LVYIANDLPCFVSLGPPDQVLCCTPILEEGDDDDNEDGDDLTTVSGEIIQDKQKKS
jgi:hypothetical protein